MPANYKIIPAAENLKHVRLFAVAPDKRIFVTDLFDISDNRKGAVYILDAWNSRLGKFGKVVPFMTNLRNPNSVAFYTDVKGQDWFYLAETDLKNSFLVALHGSTDRNDRRGYKIVTVRENNRQQDFITGFVEGRNTFGRPCDVMKISPDSFLFTDDRGRVVYYVRRMKK